jgi:L-ascorbate metabolism protein UlaG (beta-lactamase superfamily)
MKLIGERNSIDVALLPIGDNFTMGIQDALYALKLINPKKVVPMHYNTFPIIAVDVTLFAQGAQEMNYECVVLNPGESLTL